MHLRIHAAFHQAKCARSPGAWLFIDNVPIEQWLHAHLKHPDLDLSGLSLMWLLDEAEDALARRRFTPAENGTSTPVPLLVCSSDMDFDCYALMTEQVIEGDKVHWRRFGWSATGGLEVGISTQWDAENHPVSFDLTQFNAALEDFDRLLKGKVAE